MRTAELISAAHYAPGNAVDNHRLSEIMDTSDDWILSRTGISSRHISTGENTSDLCARVAESLLEKSGVKAEEISLIIVATMSPDYLTPSTACLTQSRIGAVNALAFDINAACSGFIYALSCAQKYIATGFCDNAIVIGAETMSKLLDWSDRSSSVIFGDGAGGVLLKSGTRGGILGEDLHSDGCRGMAINAKHMTPVNPYSKAEQDNRGVIMNGRDVFDFATREVPKSIDALFDKTSSGPNEIKYIIPHQANSRIVSVVAKKLNLPLDKFYLNIERYGNTSSASIPIALSEMMEKGLIKAGSGEKVIMTGFGGGLTWGSLLYEM